MGEGEERPADRLDRFLRCITTTCEARSAAQEHSDLDAHGCKHSTGEEYCEATKKCIRPWLEKCEEFGCSDCQDRQKRGENISLPDVRHDGLGFSRFNLERSGVCAGRNHFRSFSFSLREYFRFWNSSYNHVQPNSFLAKHEYAPQSGAEQFFFRKAVLAKS